MLVEIPDPEVIMSVIVAFLVGLFGLYIFYKVKPYINTKPKAMDSSYMERLEYYERQLIDMKIRLDSLDLVGLEQKDHASQEQINEIVKKLTKPQEKVPEKQEIVTAKVEKEEPAQNLNQRDIVEYVLRLITNKAMTSRDIQITIGRTREHTSRLMKKLFDDGLVERNTKTKPYTYSISEKGKEQISSVASPPTTV